MPSGGLGDESDGNTRPSAECFQSAVLIYTPLRAHSAQGRVQGFSPALLEGADADDVRKGHELGQKTGVGGLFDLKHSDSHVLAALVDHVVDVDLPSADGGGNG